MSDSNEIRFKLGDYFRKGSHKVAISLPDLVQQTNSFSTKNRPGCQPTLLKSKPKELYLGYNVKCNLKESDPNGHDVRVRFDLSEVSDESTANNLDVAVACSCPAFLYWGGQWNSHQRDALEGDARPLLTAPTERLDLRNGFVICKHIKAVSERILPAVQHNVVKILREREVERRKKELTENPTPEYKRLEEKRQKQIEETRQKRTPEKSLIKDKLREVLRPREEGVVKRDTPATPEERENVPTLAPQQVQAPSTAQPPALEPVRQPGDIPEIDFDDSEGGTGPKPATTPAPPPPASPEPAKPVTTLPQPNVSEREQMRRMRQREEQLRMNQDTQRRLKNNPGYKYNPGYKKPVMHRRSSLQQLTGNQISD